MDSTIGIYIHIPFCVKKCPYCDFNSIVTSHIPDNAYINALLKELAAHIHARPSLVDKTLETVYIGGGTPSLISPHCIQRLASGIQESFSCKDPLEITLEANPGTVSADSLAAFKDAGINPHTKDFGVGVNRLSIGIQSFNDKTLNTLGRIHSAMNSLQNYEYARKAGFDNMGIDLIFGAPGQSIKEWGQDLKTAISLKPEHISAYGLTIEKGTAFFELQKLGRLPLPSEEEQVLMYELAVDKLKEAGFIHYEISNFAQAGFESKHNMRYWSHMDYIGLGAGAHSYLSSPPWGVRWWNESDLPAYMRRINETGQAISGEERLSREDVLEEAVFLGLRKIMGINTEWFSKRFDVDLKDFYSPKVAALKTKGLLHEDVNNIRLTRKGLLLSNEVIGQLVSALSAPHYHRHGLHSADIHCRPLRDELRVYA